MINCSEFKSLFSACLVDNGELDEATAFGNGVVHTLETNVWILPDHRAWLVLQLLVHSFQFDELFRRAGSYLTSVGNTLQQRTAVERGQQRGYLHVRE